jgi:hypothetical protein
MAVDVMNPLRLFLILLNVALCTVCVLTWKRGEIRIHEPETQAISNLPLPDLGALNSTPMPAVNVGLLTDQALFYSSRSFYKPAAPSVEIPPPAFELAGIMRLADGRRLAFVKGIADHTSRSVHTGDDLDGWKVQAVETDRVVLNHDEQISQLAGPQNGHSSGLIRGPSAPRVALTGIQVLSGSATEPRLERPQAVPSVAFSHARTFQPPPQVGK